MATPALLLDSASLAAVAALFVYLWLAQPSRGDLAALDEALGLVLGDLRERLNALDDLVDLLPALVPGVTLVNQNPLTNILEFLQTLRGDSVGSNEEAVMRDADGRFLDGSTTREKAEETTDAETRLAD